MKIGILTSGGDAPGMNAAIRAAVRRGISLGAQVYGIRRGYEGLLDGDIHPMGLASVGDIIHRGGTVLHTARSERFMGVEGQDLGAARVRGAGLEGIVVVGGEGSLHGMAQLCHRGVKAIGVPATIDNDIAFTDFSIGFDTALNTGLMAVNSLRDTASSHERVFILETMGRESGHLAMAIGVAGGAEYILIPELAVDFQEVCEVMRRGIARGKIHSIIVVAEGAGSGVELARKMKPFIGLELRVTVLGHVQRGGAPSGSDRLIASRMGAKAVDLLAGGISNVMVGVKGNDMVYTDIETVLDKKKEIDFDLYNLARDLAK